MPIGTIIGLVVRFQAPKVKFFRPNKLHLLLMGKCNKQFTVINGVWVPLHIVHSLVDLLSSNLIKLKLPLVFPSTFIFIVVSSKILVGFKLYSIGIWQDHFWNVVQGCESSADPRFSSDLDPFWVSMWIVEIRWDPILIYITLPLQFDQKL